MVPLPVFHGLLYIDERETYHVNLKGRHNDIDIYLRCAALCASSVRYHGCIFRLITNNRAYVQRRLAALQIPQCEVVEPRVTLDVPRGIRFYGAHFKIEVYTLFGKRAFGDWQGQQRFVRDELSGSTGGIEGTESTFSERQWNVSGQTILVDTVTLDQERSRAETVDLIKIDVEGHEESVIRGGSETLKRDQPILIFECFHGATEITGFLSGLGYWIGDAERMTDDTDGTTNFLALPAQHRALLDQLRKAWSVEIGRLGEA
ncbi:MAG: FkbM family methyltransferase [Candidatus Binataceae bacterium]|nr:FkbM family methyltransferase [Candidatus Binataceae bacterium]